MTVRDLLVRPATEADDDFLRSVYAASRADEVAVFGWPAEQTSAFLGQQFDAQRACFRATYPAAVDGVIEVDGRSAGRLYADHGDAAVVVLDLALLPDVRGAGVGTAVLGALQADAAATGAPLRLHVERGNPARRLYERVGLRAVGDDGLRVAMEWTRPGLAAWAAAVGSTATLLGGPGTPVELRECVPGPDGGPYEQFTLIFRGPADLPAAQDTYRVVHPALGTLDVFLTPVARTADHVELSATFAQLHPSGGEAR